MKPKYLLIGATRMHAQRLANAFGLDRDAWIIAGWGEALTGLRFKRIVACYDDAKRHRGLTQIGLDDALHYLDENVRTKIAKDGELIII